MITALLFLAADCGKGCKEMNSCHHSIEIVNNSAKTIYYNCNYSYPDTLLNCNNQLTAIAPGGKDGIPSTLFGRWEDHFIQHAYMQFLVVDSLTKATTSCDSIRKQHLILKRFQLSLEDMNTINWRVVYE